MASSKWRVEEAEDGTVSLSTGSSGTYEVLSGTTRAEADRYVKRYFQPGDTVTQIASDGYRTDLTRRYAPPVRSSGPASQKSPSAPRRRAPVRMPLMRF